ncbi:MAG: flagellar biosynthesis protein FlhB [Pseudohongiellaceae bacterium]
MAEEAEEQEKTEEPTPRRREKAKEEGQVARSRELTTYMLLLTGVAALWLMGQMLYGQLARIMEQSFVFDRAQAFDVNVMLNNVARLAEITLLALLPLFLTLALVALTAPLMLGGWSMSAKALQPKFSKLNPLKGLKRIFSSQALIELLKVMAKAVLVGAVLTVFLSSRITDFMALMDQSIQRALINGMMLAAAACALMILTLIVVVLIDVPYQLWSHTKKLRMTKEEIKREHKESDGDPQMKSRIRSQQQEMARKRMMSKVPDADVVVTNPTHYAIALRYQDGRMAAPKVQAKGADAVAEAIRNLAREHGVPLLQAPPLARALYAHVDLDEEVPMELYTAVAEVLAWAFALKRAREEGTQAPETPRRLAVPAGFEAAPRRKGSARRAQEAT